MRSAIFVGVVVLLAICIGCRGHERLIVEDDFLEHFITSLEEQGLKVEPMEPSTSIDMQGKVPFQMSISQNGEDRDTVFVYFLNSVNQTKQALEQASFTITSLTKIGKYQKNNVIVIHYALDGNLGKYDSHIHEAINTD
ncbi:hypothetical protein [Paenibacillus sp. ACRRY]|uniref:hypothetical protein n=1 Tax=Paenibacillus sp. ACRRY TaxID=2918208 RepID=UPI001EF4E4B8|nr:hypothetical protein [Paenibacillus sp. ACRRY]MCG7384438.1 hypothetical protein [Paenibacillus sp. ACRRY]